MYCTNDAVRLAKSKQHSLSRKSKNKQETVEVFIISIRRTAHERVNYGAHGKSNGPMPANVLVRLVRRRALTRETLSATLVDLHRLTNSLGGLILLGIGIGT